MSNHENKLTDSIWPSLCTACKYSLLLDGSHSLRLQHSPETHVVPDTSYRILTLLRCCPNQYLLPHSKKETKFLSPKSDNALRTAHWKYTVRFVALVT